MPLIPREDSWISFAVWPDPREISHVRVEKSAATRRPVRHKPWAIPAAVVRRKGDGSFAVSRILVIAAPLRHMPPSTVPAVGARLTGSGSLPKNSAGICDPHNRTRAKMTVFTMTRVVSQLRRSTTRHGHFERVKSRSGNWRNP